MSNTRQTETEWYYWWYVFHVSIQNRRDAGGIPGWYVFHTLAQGRRGAFGIAGGVFFTSQYKIVVMRVAFLVACLSHVSTREA